MKAAIAKVIDWFKKLISNSPDASIKRLMMLLVIPSMLAMAFIAQHTTKAVPSDMFKNLTILATVLCGGNVADKIIDNFKDKLNG